MERYWIQLLQKQEEITTEMYVKETCQPFGDFDHVSALYRIFQVYRSFSNRVLTRLILWSSF